MKELKLLGLQARGTRILLGPERRQLIVVMGAIAEDWGCEEITLPTIEPIEVYAAKLGHDTSLQMWTFPDRSNREMCLRPEGTATIQALADGPLKFQKNLKLWYETRCFRYERPQAGRYREFTQVGVEVLSPDTHVDWRTSLMNIACKMVRVATPDFELRPQVTRGLSYYVEDGFEIVVPSLGAQQQVVGGGRYKEGIGFAIGVDRLLLAGKEQS